MPTSSIKLKGWNTAATTSSNQREDGLVKPKKPWGPETRPNTTAKPGFLVIDIYLIPPGVRPLLSKSLYIIRYDRSVITVSR